MEPSLREQFIFVMMRFKRVDLCPSSTALLQQSELAVMAKASAGCTGEGAGISVSDIQQNLHISKPAVSQTLNNLEKKGYVIRMIDTNDRRKITVTPTPEGEAVLAKAKCSYEESLDSLLEQYGIQNVRTLADLINRLMDVLENS